MKHPEEIITDAESIWQSLPYWSKGGPLLRIKLDDYLTSLNPFSLEIANKKLEHDISRMADRLQRMRAIKTVMDEVLSE